MVVVVVVVEDEEGGGQVEGPLRRRPVSKHVVFFVYVDGSKGEAADRPALASVANAAACASPFVWCLDHPLFSFPLSSQAQRGARPIRVADGGGLCRGRCRDGFVLQLPTPGAGPPDRSHAAKPQAASGQGGQVTDPTGGRGCDPARQGHVRPAEVR